MVCNVAFDENDPSKTPLNNLAKFHFQVEEPGPGPDRPAQGGGPPHNGDAQDRHLDPGKPGENSSHILAKWKIGKNRNFASLSSPNQDLIKKQTGTKRTLHEYLLLQAADAFVDAHEKFGFDLKVSAEILHALKI